MPGGSRRFVPEQVKAVLRALRVRLYSVGLPRSASLPLPAAEREASASMSVVVPVHDSPDVTRRCLRSLELYGGDSEVVVVDDGSKLAATKSFLDESCARNAWRLVRNAAAKGHSRASEAGVAASTRPIVCLLNSDALVSPRTWLGVARAFESDPRIGVVGPSTSETSTRQLVERAYRCRRYWSDAQIWGFAEKYVAQHGAEPLVDLPYVGGFGFFIRRTVWEEAGGFDRNLPDYGNELDLCRRVAARGVRIVWTPAAYVHHLGNESYGKTIGTTEIERRCEETLAYIRSKPRP